MAIVALLDPGASVSLQVAWALWFARARRSAVTLLLPQLTGSERQRAIAKIEAAVSSDDAFCLAAAGNDQGKGKGERYPASIDAGGIAVAESVADESAANEPAAAEERLRCRIGSADLETDGDVVAAVGKALPDLFVVLLAKVDAAEERVARIGREILPRVSCSAAVVDLGDARWPVQHLMVAASRGAHPRVALQLARELAVAADGKLTGAYVEPDIGSDATSVGNHVLHKVLRGALHEKASEVARRVVVGGAVDVGLQKAAEAVQPDAIVLGMPRPGLLGSRFFRLTPARLCKRVEMPVIIHRQALPLGNRVRRSLEDLLQRLVPQVERETRVELSARVQSSSAWNFDFIALISLSTVIAALGLLQDSAAVIIGAMLIAPLMTPILGVGLAVAQGNAMLARLAFRAILFGVGTSFALAVCVGLLDIWSHPLTITDEMVARCSPGVIDLLVAFVSGLAAAYANSRPGLVAALPGVAIAAALVPPIATSGLAFAAGRWGLAYGSLLLFVTNMVAIVLAAGLSLWAVGVRKERGRDRVWLRHLGNGFVLLALVLTVMLTQRTRVGPIPLSNQVRQAIRDALPKDSQLQLLGATARRTEEHELVITVHTGGPRKPSEGLAKSLLAVLVAALDQQPGRQTPEHRPPLQLQLQYAYVLVADADASAPSEARGGK